MNATTSVLAPPAAVDAPARGGRFGRGRVVTVILAILVLIVVGGAVITDRPVDTWAEETLPGVGAPADAGNVTVTVLGVEANVARVGNDESGVDAHGHFVKVTVEVTNTGEEAAVFNGLAPTLVDDDGRVHLVSAAAEFLDGDELPADADVAAGESITGILLYDLPEGSVPAELQLTTDDATAPVRVELFV